MAVSLKHNFVSAVADSGDTTLVQPSNWNDEHNLTLASGKLLGRYSANTGSVQEVTISTGLSLDGSGNLTASVTSPGGSTTQLQYNNAGAFAGASGLTTNGTELTIASGTKTTSSPIIDMAQTWNAGAVTFTGLKLNVTDTASAAASNLLDLQVGGSGKFYVDKTGRVNVFDLNCWGGDLIIYRAGTASMRVNNTQTSISGALAISPNSSPSVPDAYLSRRAAANLRFGAADAAAPVAQTLSVQSVVAGTSNTAGANFTITGSQGTGTGAGGSIVFQVAPAGSSGTAQNSLVTFLEATSTRGFRIYGSYTDASNNDYLELTKAAGGNVTINATKNGTGTAGNIIFATSGTTRATLYSGAFTLGTNVYLGFNLGSGITQGTNDGDLKLRNNSDNGFGLLQFGGTTSSFPALKRSSTTLQVRLADDSAYGNLSAGQVYTPTQTLTDAATITFNANLGAVATVTLGATGRTLTPSNLVAGGTYVIFIVQDATGSRTITTWTNFRWPGGVAPTLSTAANAVDIVTGVSDGTYIYAAIQQGFA